MAYITIVVRRRPLRVAARFAVASGSGAHAETSRMSAPIVGKPYATLNPLK